LPERPATLDQWAAIVFSTLIAEIAMDCFIRVGIVSALSLTLLTGCGKSDSSSNKASGDAAPLTQSAGNNSPIAQAAHDFLDAVLKGDTQRAKARLSPQAIQRIISSGKQFSPPGLETASFKIAEIVTPAPDRAIVQCVLTDTSEGAPRSEEMCCLLRKVDNDWRVSGIAYGTTPNKPWTLSDFETGQNMAIPRQMMSAERRSQGNGGTTASAGIQPNPSAPSTAAPALGGGSSGPVNVNSPSPATAGLGMPAVGPAYQGPQGQPYTAQQPQSPDRR
jgi:hypothetical protein